MSYSNSILENIDDYGDDELPASNSKTVKRHHGSENAKTIKRQPGSGNTKTVKRQPGSGNTKTVKRMPGSENTKTVKRMPGSGPRTEYTDEEEQSNEIKLSKDSKEYEYEYEYEIVKEKSYLKENNQSENSSDDDDNDKNSEDLKMQQITEANTNRNSFSFYNQSLKIPSEPFKTRIRAVCNTQDAIKRLEKQERVKKQVDKIWVCFLGKESILSESEEENQEDAGVKRVRKRKKKKSKSDQSVVRENKASVREDIGDDYEFEDIDKDNQSFQEEYPTEKIDTGGSKTMKRRPGH